MSNLFQRHWSMLHLVPRAPARIASSELHQRLSAAGFAVTLRTVQRDLVQLAELFPDLQNDGSRDIAGWFWRADAAIVTFPALDPTTAFTFKLAESFLGRFIPPSLLRLLEPWFGSADQALGQLDLPHLRRWREKVRFIPRGQPLLLAKGDAEAVEVIYDALLREGRFFGRYRRHDGEEREYLFSPLGLVVRESVSYLVATVGDYQDPRHYALHRFCHCEAVDAASIRPKGFDFDAYLRQGSFEYIDALGQTLELVARFDPEAGRHLGETPLAVDQRIDTLADGRLEVRARVNDSRQLRWWLLGFGTGVEVMEPRHLREEFIATGHAMVALYGMPGDDGEGAST